MEVKNNPAAILRTSEERYELFFGEGSGNSLAWTVYQRAVGLRAVNATLTQNQEDLSSALEDAGKDGVDPRTGMLNEAGYTNLLEQLDESGIFEELNDKKWGAQITIVDLDKLKQHNTLGGQAGGNEAIASFGAVVSGSIFRKNGSKDNTELEADDPKPNRRQHLDDIRKAIDNNRMHDILARIGGDEFCIITLLPPDELAKRSGAITEVGDALDAELDRISEALEQVSVQYTAIKPQLDKSEYGTDGLCIDYSSKEISPNKFAIEAKLTSTFAFLVIDKLSAAKIKAAFYFLDAEGLKRLKSIRTTLTSNGCWMSHLPAPFDPDTLPDQPV